MWMFSVNHSLSYKCQALIRVALNTLSRGPSALQKSWFFPNPIPWDHNGQALIPCHRGSNLMATEGFCGESVGLTKRKLRGRGSVFSKAVQEGFPPLFSWKNA